MKYSTAELLLRAVYDAAVLVVHHAKRRMLDEWIIGFDKLDRAIRAYEDAVRQAAKDKLRNQEIRRPK